jgi:hypothetical protein
VADDAGGEGAGEGEDAMTFIVPGRSVMRVTIRKKNKRGDRILAFGHVLVQKMLENVTHVAISIDEKARTLTFYPSGKVFQGQVAHRLTQEGGGNKKGHCVRLRSTAVEFIKHIPSKRYTAEIYKDRFVIRWGEP